MRLTLPGRALVRQRLPCLLGLLLACVGALGQTPSGKDDFDQFLVQCPQSQATGQPGLSQASVQAAPLPNGSGAPRIGFWGDSHTASGHFVDAMVGAWGMAGVRALPMRVPPALGMVGLRMPWRGACLSPGWKLQAAHRANPNEGGFSPSLMYLAASTPGQALWLDLDGADKQRSLQGLTLQLAKADPQRALVLGVSVNRAPETLVSLSNAAQSALHIRPPEGRLTSIRLRLVTGQITLHALDLVYQRPPALVLDLFSVPGAMASGWSLPAMRDMPGVRYDLVVLQYGTNDAIGANFDPQAYSRSLQQSLARFRALHAQARCILIGPPDRASSGAASPNYGLRHWVISRIQDSLSREFKCEFWNWQAAMGGGMGASMLRWAATNPPWAQPDLIHLTAAGYEQSARLFAAAVPWRPGVAR